MASSAHDDHHHLPNPCGGATAAPPPTPSTQLNSLASSNAANADVLSRLLHRLPPTLSLPTRRSPPLTSPPLISLSPKNPKLLADLLSASTQLGFFQLTDHSVPPQLANSAESESLSLFDLSKVQRQLYIPKNGPPGYDCADDEDENGTTNSFCFDSSCSIESTEFSLASLAELTREMEKLGLDVIEAISCAVGFENPVRKDPTRVCSLMWVSEGSQGNETGVPGKFYPYVVGLHYQIRSQRHSLLADSGWVSVSPRVDSVLVTLGDIAQVWSNGKTKKVRGRPIPSYEINTSKNTPCITLSLLVTLPLESTVSPLPPRVVEEGDGGSSAETIEFPRVFNSFSFEDYAWRVSHERLLLKDKDPLDRYRI